MLIFALQAAGPKADDALLKKKDKNDLMPGFVLFAAGQLNAAPGLMLIGLPLPSCQNHGLYLASCG